MDQQQPQWSPPPQQPAGWGGPGYGGAPVRPTGVTLASIFLIVMGVLMALGGAACGILGGAASGGAGQDATGILGFFAGLALVAGLIALVIGILQIAAGAGALGGKGWGRWIGIIVSVVLAILLVLGGVGSLGSDVTSGVVTLVIGVLYGLTAWAFMQASAWFSYRR